MWLTASDGSHPPVPVALPESKAKLGQWSSSPAIALDDAGDAIAVATEDGALRVFDTSNGALLKPLKPAGRSPGPPPTLTFWGSFENGRLFEEKRDGQLWAWELRSGAVKRSRIVGLPKGSSDLTVDMSASGSRLVVCASSSDTAQTSASATYSRRRLADGSMKSRFQSSAAPWPFLPTVHDSLLPPMAMSQPMTSIEVHPRQESQETPGTRGSEPTEACLRRIWDERRDSGSVGARRRHPVRARGRSTQSIRFRPRTPRPPPLRSPTRT